ncbi:hypothetical protein SK128_016174, partial [Halocaridina rubra]
RQAAKQAGRQADRQAGRQAGRQEGRQADIEEGTGSQRNGRDRLKQRSRPRPPEAGVRVKC